MPRKPASPFPIDQTRAMRNKVASNEYSASTCSTIHWLSDYLSANPHNPFTFPHNPFAFPHNPLAFPEGDKLLIGHGWPAWRPKGDMTCLPCLRLRRMDELCRSSTAYSIEPHIPSTELLKTLNSYRVLIHPIRRLDRVVASRQPCPIKRSTPSG